MSITLDFHTVFYLYTNTSLILHHFMNFSARKIPLWRTLEIRHRQPGTNSAPSGETSSPAMKNPIVTGTFFFGIHIEVFFFMFFPPKNTWNWIYWHLIWRYNLWIRRNWNLSWWECFFLEFSMLVWSIFIKIYTSSPGSRLSKKTEAHSRVATILWSFGSRCAKKCTTSAKQMFLKTFVVPMPSMEEQSFLTVMVNILREYVASPPYSPFKIL